MRVSPIFLGLHIIFVESGRDYYFNYAHNCNIGVKKAMTYNPKWVVVSNDDMYKIDDVKKLRESLTKLHDGCDIVFTNEGIYHSRDVLISTRTIRRNLVVCLIGRLERSRLRMEKKFKIELIIGSILINNKIIESCKDFMVEVTIINKSSYSSCFIIRANSLTN